MRVFYKVSRDKYELIEAIADTSAELARLTGVTQGTVLSMCERYEKGNKKSQYRRIELDEEDEEQ